VADISCLYYHTGLVPLCGMLVVSIMAATYRACPVFSGKAEYRVKKIKKYAVN